MRQTKIVCTLGPASASDERLEAMVRAGMNVARLNFSHGTHAEHADMMARLRGVCTRLNQPVAILQDLCGPKMRTGALEGGRPVRLTDGAAITLTTRALEGNAQLIPIQYAQLAADVKPADRILLADGAIELRVLRSEATDIACTVIHGGLLGEHQGINVPGVGVSSPALTTKDRDDLRFGIEQGVDYIALSFVRAAADIAVTRQAIQDALRDLRRQAAREAPLAPPIIAKIEKPEAVEHLEEILAVADGIMVARGDLGVELPLADVPVLQKRMIAQANAHGVPVITATQMLESMMHAPRPTRAEVSDVANAILDGTDAVMLSGETAVGEFPVEAVATMERIAEATEGKWPAQPFECAPASRYTTEALAVSRAAGTLVSAAGARLVVVFTRTGASAHLISKNRPATPIMAYTDSDQVARQLTLWWGVTPRRRRISGPAEELIEWIANDLRTTGMASEGDHIVVMGGMPIVGKANTNFVKLHRLDA